MSLTSPPAGNRSLREALATLARWALGGLFLYMGLNKALDPVAFLKLVREYQVVDSALLLNLIAAVLPWFEVFCGLLLVLGVAVRGSALLLLVMLVPFTLLVLRRALAIHAAGAIPFCAIKFDCGCGTGEVLICRKLVENVGLMLLATWLTVRQTGTLCLRHALFSAPAASRCAPDRADKSPP